MSSQPHIDGSSPRRSQPWLIALIVVLTLALLALLVFGVGPRLIAPGRTTTPTPTPPPPPTQAATPTATMAAPTRPAPPQVPGWAGMGLATATSSSTAWSSGVDGVVIVDRYDDAGVPSVEAVDVTSMKSLWTQTKTSFVRSDAGGVLLAQGATNLLVDQRTGNVTWQGPADTVLGFDAGYLVTVDKASNTTCARKTTSPSDCVWKSPGAPEGNPNYPQRAFGGGSWFQTSAGVVDLATGAPAPFGADASSPPAGAVYDGPSRDRIIRIEYNNHDNGMVTATVQRWDASKNTGIGPVFTTGGLSGELIVSFDATGPNYFIYGSTIHAMSWQTGRQQWQTPGGGSDCWTTMAGGVLFFRIAGGGISAIDAASGKTIWHSETLQPVSLWSSTDTGGIAYFTDSTKLLALNPTTFTQVASYDLPPETTAYFAGGRVVAVGNGSLYVLQP